eukprot:g1149.t1
MKDVRKPLEGAKARSINLVLTSRGLDALDSVGLREDIEKITVPVYGRALHAMDGSQSVQKYGPDDSYFNLSVSRLELNRSLVDAAERAGCEIHFEANVRDMDLGAELRPNFVYDNALMGKTHISTDHVFGVDGAASLVRKHIVNIAGGEEAVAPLGASYKELTLRTREDGTPALRPDLLHIWPRGSHFLMGLANVDGSFTMTLYMPDKGDISFESLDSPQKIRNYFETFYAGVALQYMPHFVDEFVQNPTGFLGTLQCRPWHIDGRVALLGDACHALTPFFGQGCNASFEDVRVMDSVMDRYSDGPHSKVKPERMSDVFAAYDSLRKPNGDSIQRMALDNYLEMSDRTADAHFLLQKEVELALARAFPSSYMSRYSLVTHTLVPYSVCEAIGVRQERVLNALVHDGVRSVEDIDMAKAKELIRSEIEPLLLENDISPSDLDAPKYTS